MTEYTVRPLESEDVSEFLSLYETVFSEPASRAWFDWKYDTNPYIEELPGIVVEQGDELVGARPCFALALSVAGDRCQALQPADAMVHPDHRRKGLFTRMTKALIDRYEREDSALFFNFPNSISATVNQRLGWRSVQKIPTYYRLTDTVSMLEQVNPSVAATIRIILPTVTRWLETIQDRVAPNPPVEIHREPSIVVSQLTSSAEQAPATTIHAVRDAQFFRWRFDNPRWNYETYWAPSQSVAAVAGWQNTSSGKIVRLTDIVPIHAVKEELVLAIVQRVLGEHPTATIVALPPLPSVETSLGRLGFIRDTVPLIRRFTRPTRHVVRTLSGDWRLNGLDITDPANWSLTFAEQDTA